MNADDFRGMTAAATDMAGGNASDGVVESVQSAAQRYLERGRLSAIPIVAGGKMPVGSWKFAQERLPTLAEATPPPGGGIAVVTGRVSGGVFCLDFDDKGSAFECWVAKINQWRPDLMARLYVERSPSGGYHVFAKSEGTVPGGKVLARRPRAPSEAQKRNRIILIETRGEGNYVVVAQTTGYIPMQGDLCSLPILTEEEVQKLLNSAIELDQGGKSAARSARTSPPSVPRRRTKTNRGAADDFAHRGVEFVVGLLTDLSWRVVGRTEDRIKVLRPNKDDGGESGNFQRDDDGRWMLRIFSTAEGCEPFAPDETLSLFDAYARLRHRAADGSVDERAAGIALRNLGFSDSNMDPRPTDAPTQGEAGGDQGQEAGSHLDSYQSRKLERRKNVPEIHVPDEDNDEYEVVQEISSRLPSDDRNFCVMDGQLGRIVSTRHGNSKFELHTHASLRGVLHENFRFVRRKRTTADGTIGSTCAPLPDRCIDTLLAMRCYPDRLPIIESVTPFPVLRSDGQLSSQGFDRLARVYCESDAACRVPEAPTREQANAAFERLWALLDEFCFLDPSHRSVWMAILITLIVRPALGDASVPMIGIDGTGPGVGKSLLVELALMILTGRKPPVLSYPTNEDEIGKLITTILIGGNPFMYFDDVQESVGGGTIQRYVTSPAWTARLLSSNKQITLPTRALLIVTGNNIQWKRVDMLRRVLPIRLVQTNAMPAERVFQRDVRQAVREGRDQFLIDVLTIVRGFAVAGRPQANLTPFGSFEEWTREVRQIFAWLVKPDPHCARTEFVEEQLAELEARAALLRLLRSIDESESGLTAQQILEYARSESGIHLRRQLDRVFGIWNSTHGLGKALRSIRENPAGGLKLVHHRGCRNRLNFIEEVTTEVDPPSCG